MEVIQNRKLLAYKPLLWESAREIYEFQMIELNKANKTDLDYIQSLESSYCLIILRGKIIGLSKLVNIDSDVVRLTASFLKYHLFIPKLAE